MELPKQPGVVMLAAPTVFWVNGSGDVNRAVSELMSAPPALAVDYLGASSVWIWWHVCPASNAARWAEILQVRLQPECTFGNAALRFLH